jgi:hypothetical protein
VFGSCSAQGGHEPHRSKTPSPAGYCVGSGVAEPFRAGPNGPTGLQPTAPDDLVRTFRRPCDEEVAPPASDTLN